MRKKLIAGLLAAALTVTSVPGVALAAPRGESGGKVMAEIYVSASSEVKDPDGSEARPYAGMEEARQAVRKLNDNMTGDIVVYFDDGEYLLEDTVSFDQEDSGSNGYQILYKARENAKPVLTSGLEVTGWEDAGDSKRPGLLAADVDIPNTRQFFVDGEMATRAKGRIPGGMNRAGEKKTYTTYNGNHDAYKGFLCSNTDILNWRNPSDIEFVWDISWAHRISPIKSITQQDDSHTFIEMEWDSFKTGQIAGGVQITREPDYAENAYELLDEPGEWYFDRQEKRLYYMPKAGQDMDKVQAIIPSVENLITVEGSLDEKAENIAFEGFTLEYNTWLYPSTKGWPEQQANFAHDPREEFNMHAYSLAPGAAVVTKLTKGIIFDGCTFRNLGSAGINMLEGSTENRVQNCVFKDISAGGVLVGGVSITEAHPLKPGDTIENHIANKTEHDERLIVKNNTITNNYFNGIGTEYKGSIGIVAGYTDGTVITNNTVRNVAYSGISVGWGWGFWDQGGRYKPDGTPDNETPAAYPRFPLGDAAVSRNNVIENNDISQCMMKLHDGAGIYTLGDMPGSSIRGNLIHDNVGWPGGIYLDEGSGGMTVDENITYNVQVDLNHNVREHTYGYKADHFVDGGSNHYGVKPGSSSYPAELAARAGVQDVNGQSIIPIELNNLMAPEFITSGDKVILEGNFGEETGRVALCGENGTVYLDRTSEHILSWNAKKILIRIPGGIVTGPVWIESASGTKSNTKKINVGDFTEELFADDFDSYEEGQLSAQESAANRYTAIVDSAYVEKDEDGSQFLRINKSGGSDARIEKKADWQDVMVAMDLRYDVNPHDFGGFFLSPRFQDHGNKYLVLLTPNYSNGLGYQQYVGGSLNGPGGGGNFTYKVGAWYSAKIAIVGQEMKVKVWEKGKPEPALWNSTTTFSGVNRGGLLIQLTSLKDAERASIDNLRVLGYEAGATADVSGDYTAPAATALVTGNRSQENPNLYHSDVRVELTAQDDGTGVADIEYRLGDGEFTTYTEPLLLTGNGDYTLSYRATDRAGNAGEVQTLQLVVDLQPGELIFEDDFEDYAPGSFTDLEKKGYTAINKDAMEIAGDDAGQLLKLRGIGQDVRLLKYADWENTVMTFDYKYQNQLGGLEGLYPSNYFQSLGPDSMYAYPMLPGWGGVLLQQNVNGNASNITGISNEDYPLQNGVWYTVKMQTSSDHMAFKIWHRGEEEPAQWMAQRDVSGLSGGGGLHLSFSGKANENEAYIDNIQVRGFEVKAKETRVTFEVLPQDAKITVTDAQFQTVNAQADKSYLLKEGTYSYSIEAEGYLTAAGTLKVNGEMTQNIRTALIRCPASREKLDELIKEACNITEAQLQAFTDESVSTFKTALAAAVSLSKKAAQEEVDAAAKALDEAIRGLERKPDNPIPDNPAPGDKEEPQTVEISSLSISGIPAQTHTGGALKPKVTIKDGNKVLKENTDYTLTYRSNVKPGTAQVVITGKGNYRGSITRTFVIKAKKGKTYTAGSYKYKVLNASTKSGTVSLIKPVKKTLKTARVPGSVKIGNYRYKVTEIARNAFRNNKRLTTVTIEKYVTRIHPYAFYGDKKLKKITVKSKSLKLVGKNAFRGIYKKAVIKVPSSRQKKYRKLMRGKGQSSSVIIKK